MIFFKTLFKNSYTLCRVMQLLTMLWIFALPAKAQMSCGNEGIHEHFMQNDPEYKERFIHFMEDIQKNKNTSEYSANARASYVIPVVVHLIYAGDSDPIKTIHKDSIIKAIDELNESYDGTGIQFCLATRDAQGNRTDGINRVNGRDIVSNYNGKVVKENELGNCSSISDKVFKSKTISNWPQNSYYNIWVFQEICGSTGDIGGYGTFPWTSLDRLHGVSVVAQAFLYPSHMNTTNLLAHETGHYLGLLHTFQGGCTERFCDEGGDQICDTPPHGKETCGSINLCNYLSTYPWNNSRYNYMNYCDDIEKDLRLFTPMQIGRMKYWLTSSESPRKTLLSSLGCSPPPFPDLTITNASASPNTVDAGANVNLSFRVNNIGSKSASPSYTSFHLSSNTTLTPGQNGDIYLDEYYISQTLPASGTTSTITKSVKIPANTNPGTYYIFLSADGAGNVDESNESNNQANVAITVRGTTQACTPSVPSGLSQTSSQTSATLRWSPVSGAQSYNVRYRGSGSWMTFSTANTSIDIPGLTCGTSYEWQVSTVCANGGGSYSNSRSFSTTSCGSINCPPQNDNCNSATTIISNGAALQGSVACANSSGLGANNPVSGCGGCSDCTPCRSDYNGVSPSDKDVFYRFQAVSSTHTITVSNANFDGVLEIRSGCNSGCSNYIGSTDPSGSPSTICLTYDNFRPSTWYYIRVFKYGAAEPSNGTFNIKVDHTPLPVDCEIFNYFPEVYQGRSRAGDNSDESLVIHTTQYGCNYRVTKGSGCNFVTLDNPTGTTTRVGSPPYFGQAEIFYDLDRNDTYSQRTCTLTVNGKRHVIVQNGCDPYFYPDAKSVPTSGGSYTLEVDAESFCSWSLSQNNCSWVTFSQTSGSGTRNITVTVSPNTTSTPRVCKITLNNGEVHTINQQGIVCTAPSGVNITSSSLTSTLCDGGTLRLTAYDQDCSNCTYTWSNGAVGSYITISAAGRYSVTASNQCGSRSSDINITRAAVPVVTVNNPTICKGEQATLVATGADNYYWYEEYSSGNTIQVSPDVTTMYTVEGTKNGCSATATATVTVRDNGSTATITASGATTFCEGGSVRLTASQGSSYLWSTGARTQSITVTQSGDYTVSVTKDGCSATSPVTTVKVNQKPVQSDSIMGNSAVCSGTSQTYTVPAVSGATSYTWAYTGGNNPTGTTRSISFSPTSSGTLSVVANNGCGASIARTLAIVITATTPNQPGNINGNTTVCNGTSQTYSVPAVSGVTSYEWTYSGGGNPTGTTRSISFSPTSSGTLSVVAKNGCGSSTAVTRNITVNPLPARPGTITPSATNVCSGTTVTYTIQPVNGAIDYTWAYSGGGNPTGKGTSISFKPTSSGTLTVVANNNCGSGTSRALAVTVNTLPDKPAVSANGATSFCTGGSVRLTASQTGVSYQWRRNGSNLSGETNRNYTASTSGTYTLVTSNSCGNSAVSDPVVVSVANTPARPGEISPSATNVCSGTRVTYSVPAISGATFEWSYSGGGNPTGTTRSISFSPTSSGTLTVVAHNACGISTARTLAVTVKPLPARPSAITPSATNVCSGTTVTYTIPPVNGAIDYTWAYSGGGNPTGKGASVSFKPTSSGTLTVVANNDCGLGTSRALAVTVNTVPDKPAISVNGATSFCTGGSVRLTASPTGVSYQWRRNGSNLSGETNRNYTASTSGTYTLVTSNSCGNSAVSDPVVVSVANTPARPGAIEGSREVCSGTLQTYSVPAANGITDYTWTYSGGGNPSGTGRTISFRPTGSGTLSVVAKNGCGESTSREISIKVISTPARPGAIGGNRTVCSGATETYQVAAVAGAEAYKWTYSGGGNPVGTGRSITLKPTSSGTLTVVAENSCGTSTSRTLAITINPLPARPADIIGNRTVCSGTTETYQIPAVTGAESYTWTYSGGGNPSGTGRSITLKPTSSGTLTVVAKNACGSSAARSLAITVTPLPARPGAIQGSATVCKGTNQTYFVDADNNVTEYIWSYSGEETVTGTGRSVTFRPTTTGTLSVIAQNACGSSAARTLRITVRDGAPASQPGAIRGETTFCSGVTQIYTISPVDGATGYLWTYSGQGTPNPVGNGTSVSLTPVTSGTLRVVALSGCGSSVARPLSLIVRSLPAKPVVDRIDDVLIVTNYSSGIQWYYNGNPMSNETKKSLIIDKKGKYSVEHTNANGCKSMSDIVDVLTVSVDEKQIGIEAFRIYPNPNDGYFTIELESTKGEDATLEIVNVLGQVISSKQLNNLYGKQTIQTDLSEYGKGIYFVNLYYNGEIINRRVVVQ